MPKIKKSPSKKANTKTKKTKIKKTARDKKIEEQQPWLTEKEFPMEYRNQFSTVIEEIDTYIKILQEQTKAHAVNFDLDNDLKLFQSYRYGWAVGWYEGTAAVLDKIKYLKSIEEDDIKEKKQREEDHRKKVNKVINDYVEEKKDTGDPLWNTNDDIQFKVEDDNEELNNRFSNWWQQQNDPEHKSEYKSMTFEDLDKYDCISFGAYLNISFEDFDKFVKKYCWSRRRVGFWRTNEWGTQTFHFDATNEEELSELTKDFRVRQVKRLLEKEGIIEPIENE
jgi:hypothetical protein|tara:strand:+ start:188 stop:1027 length:840 start_codon:yes stop_codon:yes gene_type:complete